MRVKMDLDEIGDVRTILDPGKYLAKLIGCEEDESSSGNPMLVWKWKIAKGEYKGEELTSYTSLQEHALFGLKAHLEGFGLSGDVDQDTDELIGRYCGLKVGKSKFKDKDTGEDRESNRIIGFFEVKGEEKKKASPQKKKKAEDVFDIPDEDDIPF